MRLYDEKGMAILGVIVAVLIFSSLGATILSIAERESMIARDEEEALQALYAAEGGIRKVLMQLSLDPGVNLDSVCDDFHNHQVGEGKIESLVCTEWEGYVDVTVTGVSGRARKTLIVRISKPAAGENEPDIIFWKEKYAIY